MAKILLVDDDATMRQVVGHTLEGQGFRCEQAPSGRDGLVKLCEATAAGDPFDCILLDIAMPEISGWQFVEAVKSNPLWRGTKIVLLTGYAGSARDVARATAMDCLHCVKKGEFLDMLGPLVERLVTV
jgi:CheY-like chemotaxis protein